MARPAVGGRDGVDHLAVDGEFAAGRPLEAGDHAQQRRLAAAGRADEDDELAVGDLQIDVVQHVDAAEGLRDIGELDVAHDASPISGRFRRCRW